MPPEVLRASLVQVDVQQVMTPGGSIREVLVRCSFDYLLGNSEGLFRDPLPGKGAAWAAGCAFTPTPWTCDEQRLRTRSFKA